MGYRAVKLLLGRAGIKFDKYFASEIDKYAIKLTQHHYPNTIQLGDITKLKGIDLPKIDLLIGGSPCQGFSFAGKQLNFNDQRSKLFFEYIRLLEECEPKYFLFENVKMKKEYLMIISDYLGIEPVEINSALFSAQNRKRLYWTNIPILPITKNSNNYFNKSLYRLGHGYINDEIKFFEKYPALAAQTPASKYRIVLNLDKATEALKNNRLEILRKGESVTRPAYVEECENFQTLPIHYTAMLSKTQRYKCIGNCWTVDVIAHIFNGLVNIN